MLQTYPTIFFTPRFQYLKYIKQNRLKDTLWKREQPAQMALPPIVTSMPPGTAIKGEGFYAELFCLPLGVVAENVSFYLFRLMCTANKLELLRDIEGKIRAHISTSVIARDAVKSV